VFIDYSGIASGDFEQVILENINARAHFLVLLTPSALERCGDPQTCCAVRSKLRLRAGAISCR
jgi:hypothetical protein